MRSADVTRAGANKLACIGYRPVAGLLLGSIEIGLFPADSLMHEILDMSRYAVFGTINAK